MGELQNFSGVRVVCVGDLILDRFVQGSVNRISPESPVPIISVNGKSSVPGGAANVARNIAALGAHCTLIGVHGDDFVGRELAELLLETGQVELRAVTDNTRPTSEKIRFVAQGQQLLRADNEKSGQISSSLEREIVAKVAEAIKQHHILVLSDYAKGVLTDTVLRKVIALARDAGIPIIVDPKSQNFKRYAGATVLTPNVSEAKLATGLEIVDNQDAEKAGAQILNSADLQAVLLTRSERGMSLIQRGAEPVHVPASAREVFDLSGAGDTVVATLALCVAKGLALKDAAITANVAAGIVVGKRGTATVTLSELQDELDHLARKELMIQTGKVKSLHAAVSQRQDWASRSLRVGFTNGCFDILHLGHVRLLEFARSQCDRLIVGINSDASVSKLKGPGRPVNMETDRAQILAALTFVDQVVIFGTDTPLALIEALQPDLLVKGADYKIGEIVGEDVVRGRGGKVVTFELLPNRSTSNTIAKVKTAAEPVT